VLDAFAMIDGTPVNTSAGKVMNDPPPATAFIAPARNAAAVRSMAEATGTVSTRAGALART
jgi:hypothetical protein